MKKRSKVKYQLILGLLVLAVFIAGCVAEVNQALLDEWNEKSAEWDVFINDKILIAEQLEDCALSASCSDETFKGLCEDYIQKYSSEWKNKIKDYKNFLNNNSDELEKLEINFQYELSKFNDDEDMIVEGAFMCNEFLKDYEAGREVAYCSDGTPVGECSEAKPWLCDFGGFLIPRCDVCGCPDDYSCEADGMCIPER